MPSVYDLKPKFQNLLRPITRWLAKRGVTANQVTTVAALISILCGLFIYLSEQKTFAIALVPLVLFLRMALNAIDGMLAREHQMKSHLGAILNELGDVISDNALYLPLISVYPSAAQPIVLFCLLCGLSEMTGILGIQIGASRRYDGPMGKSDRAFVIGLIAIAISFGIDLAPSVHVIFWILSLLVAATIFKRARNALKEAK